MCDGESDETAGLGGLSEVGAVLSVPGGDDCLGRECRRGREGRRRALWDAAAGVSNIQKPSRKEGAAGLGSTTGAGEKQSQENSFQGNPPGPMQPPDERSVRGKTGMCWRRQCGLGTVGGVWLWPEPPRGCSRGDLQGRRGSLEVTEGLHAVVGVCGPRCPLMMQGLLPQPEC